MGSSYHPSRAPEWPKLYSNLFLLLAQANNHSGSQLQYPWITCQENQNNSYNFSAIQCDSHNMPERTKLVQPTFLHTSTFFVWKKWNSQLENYESVHSKGTGWPFISFCSMSISTFHPNKTLLNISLESFSLKLSKGKLNMRRTQALKLNHTSVLSYHG